METTTKKIPLYEFITPEFLTQCYQNGITTWSTIATEVKTINGGTCAKSTVGFYMKKYGLYPDKPSQRMQIGLDIKKVEEVFGLLKPYDLKPITVTSYESDRVIRDAVLMISDLQIGAMDTDDGFDPVPEKTLITYMDTLKSNLITTLMRRKAIVHNFHLFLLGDIVDGELIYPSQQTIDMSKQMRMAITIIIDLIEFLKNHATGFIYIHSVAGNHGRVSFKNHKRSNWDNVIIDVIDIMYEDSSNIFVNLQNHDTVKITRVGDWNFLYTHGHLIKGMFTRDKLKSKTQDWYFSVGEFDASLFGHWHTATYLDINGKPILINGCAYKSEYIRKQLGGIETMGMILFEVGNSRPIQWFEILDVEDSNL